MKADPHSSVASGDSSVRRTILHTLRQRSALLFLCLAVLCVGLFHEYLCAACSVLLSARLLWLLMKNRRVVVRINATTMFVAVTVLLYLLSAFWAVDAGVALFGFVKFLPVLLFVLLCLQEGVSTHDLLTPLPYFVAAITVVTAVLLQFQGLEVLFSVAGRLSGTFQYANTYAILCLVCLICLLCDRRVGIKEGITALILLFGILYSGSRTVFVFTGLTLLVLLLRIPGKWVKLLVPLGAVAAMGLFVLWAALTDNMDILRRFTTISLGESTFVGRLLYWWDALPQVWRHPFGMGYMGYYFTQATFQTGVYSVTFVHNDFLQLALDVGWLPPVLLAVAVGKTLLCRRISFSRKLALAVLCVHTFFDFNLQFVSMFMLLVLLLDWDGGRERASTRTEGRMVALTAVLAVSVYFGLATAFQYTGRHQQSLAMYPFNTFSQIAVLTETENQRQMNSLAEDILSRNPYISVAHSAKARIAYSKGDFGQVIEHKKEAIRTNPYGVEEYEDLARMLAVGSSLYRQQGDSYSATYCEEELARIPGYIRQAEERVSSLGRRIQDQPELTLSDEVQGYIDEVTADEK